MQRVLVVVLCVLGLGGGSLLGQGPEEEGELGLLPPKLGEFWYRIDHEDEAESLEGYARLLIAKEDSGDYRVEWERRIRRDGRVEKEERTLVLDPGFALRSSKLTRGGELVASVELRDEDQIILSEGETEEEIEFYEDSITSLPFLFAAMVPRDASVRLTRVHMDDTRGFKKLGTAVYQVKERRDVSWEGGQVAVYPVRIELIPWYICQVEVTGDRAILTVNHGGQRMTLSSKSTRHLVAADAPSPPRAPEGREERRVPAAGPAPEAEPSPRLEPPPPVEPPPEVEPRPPVDPSPEVEKVPERPKPGEDGFSYSTPFGAASPEELFDYLTKPELVRLWWSPRVEIELEEGGGYRLSWPEEERRIQGTVKSFERGKSLVVALAWTDDTPAREASLTFSPREGGGSTLTVKETGYSKSAADREAKEASRRAWTRRLARLTRLCGG